MPHEFSKENPSSGESAYRFGTFELSPRDRHLKNDGVVVPLPPKAFDALLCLVRRDGHLVSKEELIRTLWPNVFVTEANLTNLIVSLRKAVGRDAIRTVSKHGYSFELPVTGEPGVARSTYERFVRARELTLQRSVESMTLARDLFWTCLAEDPGFALAWAWLGRCCWFLGKFTAGSHASYSLAQAALQRSFTLDPNLAAAHQHDTPVQADTGHAADAIQRLSRRLALHPGEPESLTGLVHVLRYCGLLSESLETHRQAVEMDRAVVSGVAHTLFLAGDYAASIESYGGRGGYYLDAAAWAALGDLNRARTLLRARLGSTPLSALMTALMSSLLALLDDRQDDAVLAMQTADTTFDPEILVYFARHYARANRLDAALDALRRAASAGFITAPETLVSDAWLAPLRDHPAFADLLVTAKAQVQQHRELFAAARSAASIG